MTADCCVFNFNDATKLTFKQKMAIAVAVAMIGLVGTVIGLSLKIGLEHSSPSESTTTLTTTASTTTTTITSTTTTTTLPPGCGDGWTEHNGQCYRWTDKNGSGYEYRGDCKQECTQAGSHMASVHSRAENTFIVSLMPDNSYVWLGADMSGADHDQDTTYRWEDGTAWDWPNWRSGYPRGDYPCVVMSSDTGLWFDRSCSYSSDPFNCVCKKQM
eukprot:GFUD01011349.1.p1 GENE.GFUD01011349.1~~GFUD01011349.1.p1  ORF type:complete len:215 (-),score=22.28 GFUD01011349.1:19-663(-)